MEGWDDLGAQRSTLGREEGRQHGRGSARAEPQATTRLYNKLRLGDGIPGVRKGLSKHGEVGNHNIKDQVLPYSLLIHSPYRLVPKLT